MTRERATSGVSLLRYQQEGRARVQYVRYAPSRARDDEFLECGDTDVFERFHQQPETHAIEETQPVVVTRNAGSLPRRGRLVCDVTQLRTVNAKGTPGPSGEKGVRRSTVRDLLTKPPNRALPYALPELAEPNPTTATKHIFVLVDGHKSGHRILVANEKVDFGELDGHHGIVSAFRGSQCWVGAPNR